MEPAWNIAWRACAGLRCAKISPTELNAFRAGTVVLKGHGIHMHQLKHYSISSKPFRRRTSCRQSLNPSSPRINVQGLSVLNWVRGQGRWSTTSYSTRHRPDGGQPADYNPQEGVRFRAKDLSEKEIASIFGPNVDPDQGNWILRILHGQRLSGALDEALPIPHPTAYLRSLAATGLTWLRANYPVDEDAAIMARIEKEQREEEERLTADAERLGIYKPQGGSDKGNVYGKSGLDAIREHYESQPVKEYKSQAEEIRANTGELQPVGKRVELCMY